ncbi:hypothetical protein CUMW_100020 [Citrus unshiu]|nr:hypothetical protein CUMW_100020 [Citrus unshiu]
MVCIVQVGPKKASGYQQQYSSQALVLAGGPASNGARDLRELFSHFGEILSVKIHVGKGCGFVQFANRKDAEVALQKLQGTAIGKQTVRLSWGHNPGNKQWRGDHINHWNGAHYGGLGYSGNGYAFPPNRDPNMYVAG